MAKNKLPPQEKLRPLKTDEMAHFWVREPKGSHRSFSIFRRVTGPKLKKPEVKKIPYDPVLNVINDSFSNKQKEFLQNAAIDIEEEKQNAFNHLKEHVRNTYLKSERQRRGDAIACADNETTVINYLRDKYPDGRRRRMDFKSVESETRRTLALLKTASIVTITENELQRIINQQDEYQQKRYVHKFNSILQYLGRKGFNLFYDRPVRQEVRHIVRRDLLNKLTS